MCEIVINTKIAIEFMPLKRSARAAIHSTYTRSAANDVHIRRMRCTMPSINYRQCRELAS